MNKIKPWIECQDITLFHGDVLATAHDKCFVTSWSADDFYELLRLPAVFGYIIYTSKENFERMEMFSKPSKIESHVDLVGFVICLVAKDQCEILTICVLPEWRRMGFANKLLGCVITKAKNIGVKKIFLEVAENNDLARKLYNNQGFEEFGRRKKYYMQGRGRVDAIQLSKIIGC